VKNRVKELKTVNKYKKNLFSRIFYAKNAMFATQKGNLCVELALFYATISVTASCEYSEKPFQ
jgi:hypothetical protein